MKWRWGSSASTTILASLENRLVFPNSSTFHQIQQIDCVIYVHECCRIISSKWNETFDALNGPKVNHQTNLGLFEHRNGQMIALHPLSIVNQSWVPYESSSSIARDWIVVDLIDLLLLLSRVSSPPPSILRRRMDDWEIECGGFSLAPSPCWLLF